MVVGGVLGDVGDDDSQALRHGPDVLRLCGDGSVESAFRCLLLQQPQGVSLFREGGTQDQKDDIKIVHSGSSGEQWPLSVYGMAPEERRVADRAHTSAFQMLVNISFWILEWVVDNATQDSSIQQTRDATGFEQIVCCEFHLIIQRRGDLEVSQTGPYRH